MSMTAQQLPLELWLEIIDHYLQYDELRSMLAVCKAFRQHITPRDDDHRFIRRKPLDYAMFRDYPAITHEGWQELDEGELHLHPILEEAGFGMRGTVGSNGKCRISISVDPTSPEQLEKTAEVLIRCLSDAYILNRRFTHENATAPAIDDGKVMIYIRARGRGRCTIGTYVEDASYPPRKGPKGIGLYDVLAPALKAVYWAWVDLSRGCGEREEFERSMGALQRSFARLESCEAVRDHIKYRDRLGEAAKVYQWLKWLRGSLPKIQKTIQWTQRRWSSRHGVFEPVGTEEGDDMELGGLFGGSV